MSYRGGWHEKRFAPPDEESEDPQGVDGAVGLEEHLDIGLVVPRGQVGHVEVGANSHHHSAVVLRSLVIGGSVAGDQLSNLDIGCL